ncbi:tetratricopeptide repeat protein [Kitasatospora sp. NPDC049258]|uniref:tetratricopeptide repeat protein n=1 Tax=Kitasatospora sp. NPDC049258 TaxID=3155394 RepID=UPI0034400DE0
MAMFGLHLGDHRDSLDHLDRALAAVRESGRRREESIALWLRGQVQVMAGDYEGALHSTALSLEIDHELGERYGRMVGLITMGAAGSTTGPARRTR